MRKNILTRIAALLGTVTMLLSCEDMRFGNAFLEKAPSNDMDLETIFSRAEFAEQALAEVYRSLPDGLPQPKRLSYGPLESLTDLADYAARPNAEYGTGTLNSGSPMDKLMFNWYGNKDDGRSAWKGIRKAYIFLENIDKVQDMSDELKAIRKGEAKAIIAIHYLNMFRYYGGLPWVTKAYSAKDDFNTERLTAEQMVTNISSLLDEAAAVLPWSVDKVDDGRMTKAGCMALKVRLLLFAASPFLNDDEPYCDVASEAIDKHYVWFGKKDETLWSKVIDAGEEFMTELKANGQYALVTNPEDPRQAFHDGYFLRNNGEVLVSSRWRSTYENNIFGLKQSRYGLCLPTLEYVNMFPMLDGSDFPADFDWSNPSVDPFFTKTHVDGKNVFTPTRDPRLYETCIILDDKYQGRTAQNYKDGQEAGVFQYVGNGFGMRKFFGDMRDNKGDHMGLPYQWPIMRLPEVYLSLAEAYNETGNSDKAYEYLKMVRDRVGMPNVKSGLNKEELREQILRERCLEFGYEEVRWFDIVRWKRSDIMKSTAHTTRLNIVRKWKEAKKIDPLKDEFQDEITVGPSMQKRLWAENWDNHYFLTPFPVEEINIKYGLVQNPGY